MSSTVASSQAAIARDGYAVLERFLDPADMCALRPAVARRLDAPAPASCERPHNTLVPLRWDDAIVARLLDCEHRVQRLVDLLAAEDLRWISGYVSVKEPASSALWWHQDWWCWDQPVSFAPRAPQVAVLCYLQDTDARNAALRVLPGSHRQSTPLHALLPDAHADEATALSPTHPAMRDHPGQVTVRLRAGDAAVVDYRLLHGTHANATARRRDCILMAFAPDWRALPADVRAHLIRHPALPGAGEPGPAPPWAQRLLPRYDGLRRDLHLNRTAPGSFSIAAPARSAAS